MTKPVVSVHSMPRSEEPPGSAKANVDDRARQTSVAPEQKIESASTGAGPVASADASLVPDPPPSRATSVAGGGRRVTPPPRPAATEEDNLRPRVEKLRQASVDMLDEAADDPSLRFVLISVTLFLCFLLILLASTVFD